MTIRRLAAVVVLLVTTVVRSAGAQSPADVQDSGVDVRAAEQALAAALHARDQNRIDRLLAPGYVSRGTPDIDRATWIRSALTLCWGDGSTIDGFRATTYGDVVVASFELKFNHDPTNCRPAVLRSLITDIWTRSASGWRLQVRHAGAPPEEGAGIAARFRVVPQPPPVWEVTSELSFVATGGNTSTRTIGASGSAIHRADRATTNAAIAFLTSEADAVTSARSLSGQGRHGLRVRDRLEVFGQGSYTRDRFSGIANRLAADAGLAFTARRRPHTLAAEGGLGFTSERRLDGTTLHYATVTGTVKYDWTVVPGTEVNQVAGLQADVESAINWRGTSMTSVTVTLTRRLSFKASHAFEYRNSPVPGFRSTDMRSAAALIISFQRRPASR